MTRVAPRLTVSRFFIPTRWTRPASVTSVALKSRVFRFAILAIWDKPLVGDQVAGQCQALSSRGSAWRWTRQASVKGATGY